MAGIESEPIFVAPAKAEADMAESVDSYAPQPAEDGTKSVAVDATTDNNTITTDATTEEVTLQSVLKKEKDMELSQEAVEDMARGMVYASLAITDDKEKTLEKVGKANPWQIEALKIVTGSEENAHKPLTEILEEGMKLKLDHTIDVSGMTKGGHFLDTQGYIAHNDSIVVLSYRCTTSAFDWLTNINTTSSAWEIEEDLAQGFSGFCSGFDDLCCTGGNYKPRVHTGFYNNFLASLPDVKKHLEPLLAEDQPPRKLYVVGHSLGGGVATLAACYFLLEFDWTKLPHSFVGVTAGAPRSCCTSMKTFIDERAKEMEGSARMFRLVKDRDVVVKLPPTFLGFTHLGPAVVIEEDGTIHAREVDFLDTDGDVEEATLRGLSISPEEGDEEEKDVPESTKYIRMLGRIPKSLRDHMPEFYLKPLFSARGISKAADLEGAMPAPLKVEPPVERKVIEKPKRKGIFGRFARRRSSKKIVNKRN